MAFSYSDKNFTVIGNLCFVHIDIDIDLDNKTVFDVPPAIGDRMLVNNIIYPYLAHDGEVDGYDLGFAHIRNNKISCITTHKKGYLSFFFPIDSNK